MKLFGLVSGGKDSIYSLYKAKQDDHEVVGIGYLAPPNDRHDLESYMYQTVCSELLPSIAECLQLPLFIHKIQGTCHNTDQLDYIYDPNDEVEDLFQLIAEAKEKIEIDGICTGAICSEYQKRRVENVCKRHGLSGYHPLWNRDQIELLDEMIKSGQESILVKASSLGLDSNHVGKSIAKLQAHFLELNKSHQFNVCGEGGEYETITLDSPIYIKRLVIEEWDTIETNKDPFAPVVLFIPKRWRVEAKSTLIQIPTGTVHIK